MVYPQGKVTVKIYRKIRGTVKQGPSWQEQSVKSTGFGPGGEAPGGKKEIFFMQERQKVEG